MGALSGVRVLDLTRVLAGPYCSMMLADMGAEVIKIEVPGHGDDTRYFGPYRNGTSVYFACFNRNKKGVSLNLKSPEGKALFLKMAAGADIVLENYRPGVMDKLGIGYDVLKELNPRLIYGAVSGFGSYGPLCQLPGYDIIAQAMGGLMSITGAADAEPTRTGNSMGDILGGMNLTIGVLAALHAREVTGVGQRVDVALTDSVIMSLESYMLEYLESGVVPERLGNQYPAVYPYDSYKAKDRDFIIACGNQNLFVRLLRAMGREELLEDERFATPAARARKENRGALHEAIIAWASDKTADEAVALLSVAGVPSSPVYDLSDVAACEHFVKDREMLVSHEHPVIGGMTVLGNPVKLLGTPTEIARPAPVVPGADNEAVYCGIFGLSREELAELTEKGAV